MAFGSFGFEMELPTPDDPHGPSHPEEAVNEIQELLRSANEGNDDLANIAASMHPRAVNKVAELLEFMRKKGARFAVEYQGNWASFRPQGASSCVLMLEPPSTARLAPRSAIHAPLVSSSRTGKSGQ